MRSLEVDVLVVGAGPSGLTAAALLARQGVSVLAVSKFPGTAHTPRAHITNKRAMEVFRDLGIEQPIQAAGTPLAEVGNFIMATSFAGREIARYQAYGTGPERLSDYAAASPCDPFNVPQHLMEPVLLDSAIAQGADVRFSHELVEIAQDEHGVIGLVRDLGSDEMISVRAKYAVAADGGRSTVASQLGFEFEGQSGVRDMVNMWLEVDLTPYAAYRPAVIYWMAQPGNDHWFGTGTWICVKPFTEWVLVHQCSPNEAELDISDEAVIARARKTIGVPDIPIKVKNVSKWQVNHLVASTYRKGRVFLVGDAAHRHPPSGGLGTNTSVQDSFNLAWKLAAVVKGHAGDGLLDSYQLERQPVGRQIVERAMAGLQNMMPLVEALGLRPGQTPEEGWASLDELSAPTAAGARRREALAAAVKIQDLRSNALGVELGQRYLSNAVLDDGTPFPPAVRDPGLYYHSTTHPGACLPHAWIEHAKQRVSTLDIVGGSAFTLIVGVDAAPWIDAAKSVAQRLGIDLRVRSVGYRCEYDDVLGTWASVREVADDGAILVRPDRHVAWRCMTVSKSPQAELQAALERILDQS